MTAAWSARNSQMTPLPDAPYLAPALPYWTYSEKQCAVGTHFDTELAVAVAQILMLPEVAHGALPAQVQLRPFHAHRGRHVIVEVEERKVFIPAVRDAGNPGHLISFCKQLVVPGAVLIDGKHFVVGEQRECERIIAGQVAAEHQRRAEDGPQRHVGELLVLGEVRLAIVPPLATDRDAPQGQHISVRPVSADGARRPGAAQRKLLLQA